MIFMIISPLIDYVPNFSEKSFYPQPGVTAKYCLHMCENAAQ